MMLSGRVDVGVSRVTPPAGISIDLFEPMLGTMTANVSWDGQGIHSDLPSFEVLKIISYGESLAFGCSKEILHDWVSVVAKRTFDWAVKAVDITVVACSLVRLVLLHQGDELFCSLAFGLKVIIVGRGGPRVHLSASSHESSLARQRPTIKLMDLPPPNT